MSPILFLAIFHYHRPVEAQMSKSVVWSKPLQNFVSLFSDPEFSDHRVIEEERVQDPEYIKGQTLKVSYYEETNFVMFYENDTKITGLCGETWNLLADHLNFTLVPVRFKYREFGVLLENGSYSGLMGMLDRNEIQVILRTGYYAFRDDILDYTIPIWYTKYNLFLQAEYTYDNKWLITIFERYTSYTIVFLFLVLSIVGYTLQYKQYLNFKRSFEKWRKYFNLIDHVFYTYSIMCGQGYIPDDFHRQNKILSISKCMFAWLVYIAFSSALIYRMTNRTVTLPFTDFQSLYQHTDYHVLHSKGSMVYQNMLEYKQKSTNPDFWKRIHFIDQLDTMYLKVCQAGKKFAMLESQDHVNARNKRFCPLISAGQSYYQTWIGFGVPRGYRFKSIIDLSIIKLYEVGLMDILKDRFLNAQRKETVGSSFKTIDINQVYPIFFVLVLGTGLSLLVFIFENIVSFAGKKRR